MVVKDVSSLNRASGKPHHSSMKPETLCGPAFSHMNSNTLPAFCFSFFWDWLSPGPLPPGLHCHDLFLGNIPEPPATGQPGPQGEQAQVQRLLTWDICTRAFGSLDGEEKEEGG